MSSPERYDDVFIDLVHALFGTGMNTLQIANYLTKPESDVYNAKGSGNRVNLNKEREDGKVYRLEDPRS